MAKKKVAEVNFSMQLLNIELLEFSLTRPTKPMEENHQINFQVGMEQKFDVNSLTAFVATVITIVDNIEDANVLAKITTSCNFKIENMNDFTDSESGKVILPDPAITTLNAVAISTTRGILFSELRGTHLHGAVLPVMDPSKFQKIN
tara:strand:- start:304 stop:744 length:441 start_codon:yes stop_codon:yes gene_type:complete